MATNRLFSPSGLAGTTVAPMNAEEEDFPPGTEGTYIRGPLANPKPSPSPTPGTASAEEADLPPGIEGTYPYGPLANPKPRPSPTPGVTSAEADLPPGAEDTYYQGPLANPKPSPTPPSLTTLAEGGMNHQEMWLSGVTQPIEQQKFPMNLAQMEPQVSAAPKTPSITQDAIKDFLYGSAFA